jgi:hypothetical protein
MVLSALDWGMIFGFGEDDDAEATDEGGDDVGETGTGTGTNDADGGATAADAGADASGSEGDEPGETAVDASDGDGSDGGTAEPSKAETETEAADGETDEASGTDGAGSDEGAAEDEDVDPESISAIDRIVLDPETLVDMLAYNGQEDIGQKSKAVYSLRPPFARTVEPTLKHLEEHSVEGKADDEIHLRPFRFVVEGRAVIEQRPTRPVAKEEMDADEPTDAAIKAWIDEAMETWKDHVRGNLAESVDIFSPHGMAIVDVEYEPEPEIDSEPDADSDPDAGA